MTKIGSQKMNIVFETLIKKLFILLNGLILYLILDITFLPIDLLLENVTIRAVNQIAVYRVKFDKFNFKLNLGNSITDGSTF